MNPDDIGDGGPATDASLSVSAVAATADGGFLVAESSRIRRVGPDGNIDTVAGGAVDVTQPISAYYGQPARELHCRICAPSQVSLMAASYSASPLACIV